MSEYQDPSGNTAQFQAFANQPEPAPAKRFPVPALIGVVVAVIVVVAVTAYLAFS
jgi:hypothetical protein